MAGNSNLPRVRIRDVIAAAVEVTGVRERDLVGRCRARRLVHMRHLAMLVSRELSGQSLPAIAKVFDRDHSSIHYAVRLSRKRIDGCRDMERTADRIRERSIEKATAFVARIRGANRTEPAL